VADKVIREAHVPVLIIRDGMPSSPHVPQRVLVPLDGSELSEAVLPYITPLAQDLGWSLVILWQVDSPPQSIPVQGAAIPLEFVAERGDDEMVAYLNRVANDLQAKGIAAEPRVWFGAKAQSIVEFASQEQMDLIAMSTHGRRGIGRWLRGSTTDYILAHATIPVLTLRPPTR
jgi:nucleotide-binding universal stress UspA family protein